LIPIHLHFVDFGVQCASSGKGRGIVFIAQLLQQGDYVISIRIFGHNFIPGQRLSGWRQCKAP
jgi:hypothetical protein